MSEITILHLSDIHTRKKKSKMKDHENKLFREDVQRKLLDTVSSHLNENSTPDVVAGTGDIAFSGKKTVDYFAITLPGAWRQILSQILSVPLF
jgi:hypothetical protein